MSARSAGLLLPLVVACGSRDVIDVPVSRPDAGVIVPAGRDGYDDPAGTGTVFVVQTFNVGGPTLGFDLDGWCEGSLCGDNALAPIGERFGDQIRQQLLGGESLLLIELAGLELNPGLDDAAVTIKVYAARDADDPFFPANNFQVPVGLTTCCEFKVPATEYEPGPIARWKLRAVMERGVVRSVEEGTIVLGLEPIVLPPLRLDHARAEVAITASAGGLRISRLRLGGVVPITWLARFDASQLRVGPNRPSSLERSFADLYTELCGGPDIDLDGDGLECAFDTDDDGLIDRCCDGRAGGGCAGLTCLGDDVPPVGTGGTRSCTLDPRMADGFSVELEATGVPARIVGFLP